LIRCCVLIGSDPEHWTTELETMRARRDLLPKRYRAALARGASE
jgi:hypothetical protein